MKQNFTLSTRLQKIASYLPRNSHFIDVGSDHAYLPCYVCLHDKGAIAIAGEVVEGPFRMAETTVKAHHLNAVIDVRLGDGLAVLSGDEVKQIVIAGMGGTLISSILENGKEKIGSVERIIAQPNVDAKSVRKWINQQRYHIAQEEIVEENGHFYEIIVADKMNDVQVLSEKDLLFGPQLVLNQTKTFKEKWRSEQAMLEHVLRQLEQASVKQTEKLRRFNSEISLIKEVLQDEGHDSQQ